MSTDRISRLRAIKRRLGKNRFVFHVYQFFFRALLNPANAGNRLQSARNYIDWFLFRKPRGETALATLPNGLHSTVYPDSDSGVSYLFDADVDRDETVFIRSVLSRGDFIIDAGCNVGNRTLALADVIGGAVLIDANPNCLARVEENLRLNQLPLSEFHLTHTALGAHNGTVEFPADVGTSTQNAIVDQSAGENTITVPMARLDDLVGNMQIPPVTFLKTDLEGYDLDALKGSTALLTGGSVKLVFFERWPSTSLDEYLEFFHGLGWEVFALGDNGACSSEPALLQSRNNLFARPGAPSGQAAG